MKLRDERAIATRSALILAGRQLFAERGFHGTGTHEIVERAGVTRGALQHHFPRKEDLFLAVFMQVEQDMTEATGSSQPAAPGEAWSRLRQGLGNYIEAAATPEVQRIILIDGPAVLGWTQWRQVEAHNGLAAIEAGVRDGIAAGLILDQQPRPLAHLILSIVNEAALMVANADDPSAAMAAARVAVDTLLSSLT